MPDLNATTPAAAISVLLPVHRGVDPAHLLEAVESVLTQTRSADEIVVVEDGPLTAGHLCVLDELEVRHPRVLRVVLAVNSGAGVANQEGLQRCSSTWIAKVDADDVLLPERFERQLQVVERDDLDVCGAAMSEFVGSAHDVVGVRVNPLTQKDIARRMRWNNPINHPTAFYRRDLALAVGGYPAMRYMQDYDLFARLLVAGARMINLSEPLVLFRADPRMMARRRAKEMHALERQLQRNLQQYGITSRPVHLRNLLLRSGARMLPRTVMTRVHDRLFRQAVPTS